MHEETVEQSIHPLPADPLYPLTRATYVFTLVPDADGQPPEFVECTSMESMISELYTRMIKHGSGWVYPVVNGQRAVVSMPRQLFQLKMTDGTLLEVADPASPAFDAGRFLTLRERT